MPPRNLSVTKLASNNTSISLELLRLRKYVDFVTMLLSVYKEDYITKFGIVVPRSVVNCFQI